jgi:hypothetical protein
MKHMRSALVVTLVGLLISLAPLTQAGHTPGGTIIGTMDACVDISYHRKKMKEKNPNSTTYLLNEEQLEVFGANYNSLPPITEALITAVSVSSKPTTDTIYVGIEIDGCMRESFKTRTGWLDVMMKVDGWKILVEIMKRGRT